MTDDVDIPAKANDPADGPLHAPADPITEGVPSWDSGATPERSIEGVSEHQEESGHSLAGSDDILPGPNEIAALIERQKKREQYGNRVALEAMLKVAHWLWVMAEKHDYRGKRFDDFADARNISRTDAYRLLILGPIHQELLEKFDAEAQGNPRFEYPSWRQVAKKVRQKLRQKPAGDRDDGGGHDQDEADPVAALERERNDLQAQVKAATQQFRNERAAKEEAQDKTALLESRVAALEQERSDLLETVARLNAEIERFKARQLPVVIKTSGADLVPVDNRGTTATGTDSDVGGQEEPEAKLALREELYGQRIGEVTAEEAERRSEEVVRWESNIRKTTALPPLRGANVTVAALQRMIFGMKFMRLQLALPEEHLDASSAFRIQRASWWRKVGHGSVAFILTAAQEELQSQAAKKKGPKKTAAT